MLSCPDRARHRADDPHADRHDSVDAAIRSVALLSEGRCPACPAERLEIEAVTLYGADRSALRCGCCCSLWLLDGREYNAVERGRLVQSLPSWHRSTRSR